MTQQVLFNGAILVRPGASTKIDASQFQNITLSGLGTVGLIGEADGGEPRTVQRFTSPEAVKAFYKSGPLVEAAAIAAAPGNDPRIPSGAQAIVTYKVNNSTKATLAHDGKHTFKSKQYGFLTNNITVALAVGDTANERIITITDLDYFGGLVTEVSPSLGALGKFSILYTGAATVNDLVVTATGITTTTSTASIPADDLAIVFSDFASLNDIIVYINNHPNYTCTALVTNAVSFDPTNLDTVASLDIMTLKSVFSLNFDLADWINSNSAIISDTLTLAQTGPAVVLTTTALAGGSRGMSASSNWADGFVAMRGTRINQIVPLASENAIGAAPPGGAGVAADTYVYASILASLVAHCKFVSSTAGRNECQGWSGMKGTLAELIAAANLQNSEHLSLFGEKTLLQRTSDGEIVTFPEWATAVSAAGMRAGAPLGEPLTWKYVQSFGVTSDASWSENDNDDVVALTLNGVAVVNNVLGKGFRIDKMITTFTKADNDAYTEETIVQIWKSIAYELRGTLEDVYVGRPGSLQTVQTVPAVVSRVLELFRQAGSITDSLINGVVIKAYRNITVNLSGDVLSVGVTISPTPGINFVLNTIVLVPAQISL